MKHKVTINVADRAGNKQTVLQSGTISLPKRLLTFLFGEFTDVLVLTRRKRGGYRDHGSGERRWTVC